MVNEAIRQRLFSEANLNYEKAVNLALNMEAAEINSGLIGKVQVHNLAIRNLKSKKTCKLKSRAPCRHCVKNNHVDSKCFFRLAQCHTCGATGHTSSVCRRSRATDPSDNTAGNHAVHQPRQKPRPTSSHIPSRSSTAAWYPDVGDTDDQTTEEEEDTMDRGLRLYNLKVYDEIVPPIEVKVLINRVKLLMEVDTGSGITII